MKALILTSAKCACLVLLITVVYCTSCSKSNDSNTPVVPPSQLILGKWLVDSSVIHEGNSVNSHLFDTNYVGHNGSYETFTSDGHIYQFTGMYYDTAIYSFISDTQIRWQQISSASISQPVIMTIKTLTANKIFLYASLTDSDYTPPAVMTESDYYHK